MSKGEKEMRLAAAGRKQKKRKPCRPVTVNKKVTDPAVYFAVAKDDRACCPIDSVL